MNNKLIGAILLVGAAFTAAISVVGAENANSVVLAAFISSKMGGRMPPSPGSASPHWLIFVMVAVLTLSGLALVFRRDEPK